MLYFFDPEGWCNKLSKKSFLFFTFYFYITRSCITCLNEFKMDGSFVSRSRSRRQILKNSFTLNKNLISWNMLHSPQPKLQWYCSFDLEFCLIQQIFSKNKRNAKYCKKKKMSLHVTCWINTHDRWQVIFLKTKLWRDSVSPV